VMVGAVGAASTSGCNPASVNAPLVSLRRVDVLIGSADAPDATSRHAAMVMASDRRPQLKIGSSPR
jgi:hypothetical protein